MCFPDPPDPPKVTSNPDSSLVKQRVQMELDQAALKKENKARRLEQAIALQGGKLGRKSLFSGGQGGKGFGDQPKTFGNVGAYQPGNHYSLYNIPPSVPVSDPVTPRPGRGRLGGPGLRRTGPGATIARYLIAQQLAGEQ